MTETTEPNILFVINPKSGSQSKDYETLIQSYFKTSGCNCHFFYLKEKHDDLALDETIKNIQPQIVTAVGGDGTISLVAKKILGTPIKLGILPAGSANGMAKELNISEDYKEALQTIAAGYTKKADVLFINNLLCLHLSDIGLNARLVKYFEEGNMRGHWGYARVALKVFLSQQHMRVTIRYGTETIQRNALMVVLANASKYGSGAVINPNGSPYDGLFEVVIIKQMGFITLLKMWFKPLGLSPDHTEIVQAHEVTIQTQRKMHFQVDGEYIGKVKKINAHIVPAQLNIIIPKEV
jgi:YegS/Rv2252/BmrU family lipid kinase